MLEAVAVASDVSVPNFIFKISSGIELANTFPDLIRTLQPPVPPTLNDCTWSKIRFITDLGTQANYWAVGDVKMDIINGTFGGVTINDTLGFFILDLTHRPEQEGVGIVFGGFKTAKTEGIDIAICASNYGDGNQTTGFVMNQSKFNGNGWSGSYMRNTIIPQFVASLSTDLKNNIRTSTIYSHNTLGSSDYNDASYVTLTNDKVYLLAEFEIFGASTYANSYEKNQQKQMAYYKDGNSKVKHRHSSTSSAVLWWERSANCRLKYTSDFCLVSDTGQASSGHAYGSFGFMPVFRL